MKTKMYLAPGREKSLLRKHLWVFSGAVGKVDGNPEPGETIEIYSSKNEFLAQAAYSPQSQLVARVWSFDQSEVIDRAFFVNKIRNAYALRRALLTGESFRLVNSESDGLPGLTVDKYADYLVVQLSSTGVDFHKKDILAALIEVVAPKGIFERSDLSVRAREGLAESSGVLYGKIPDGGIEIAENNAKYIVDIKHGQKTGFYFDQRDARFEVAKLAAGRKVLNAFSYTGAFGVACLLNGALHVTNIDSSAPALEQCTKNMELNGIKPELYVNEAKDVFDQLRKYRDMNQKFDLIILDPPKFIDSQKALMRGCRAYQDIARLGYKLLNPGGILVNFSCSGLMTAELFQKITADAAVDAGVSAVIIKRLEQSCDHPTLLSVPESFYLKGLITKIV